MKPSSDEALLVAFGGKSAPEGCALVGGQEGVAEGPRKPGGGGDKARRNSLLMAEAWTNNARRRVRDLRVFIGHQFVSTPHNTLAAV